jgi:hypothetical protein
MTAAKAFPLLAFATLMHVTADAWAQADTTAAPDSDRTVVTLYSAVRPGPDSVSGGQHEPAPIQVEGGGVKSAGDSCWKLDSTGHISTVAGDCYELRSAQPGETPPTR